MTELQQEQKQEIINAYNQYLTSATKLKKILKDKYTLKQIKSILDNIETQQIFRQETKKKKFIHISAPAGSYQMDLTFYTQYKKFNSGYHILLTIINMNTRYLYVYPLKTKSMKEVGESIKDFLSKTDPCSISSDKGTEFNNSELEKMFSEKKIQYIVFNKSDKSDDKKNTTSMIERANRTIRQLIDKYLVSQNTNKFIDKLPELVQAYNKTPHNSLPNNISPSQIPQDQQDWYENQRDYEMKQNDLEQVEQKYQVGQHVRVAAKKDVFSKGAKKFSVGIYKIVQINNQSITVENIKSNKQKIVRPQQIQVIDGDQVIQQEKQEVEQKQVKNEVKQVKKEAKQKRFLKKEGLDGSEVFKPAKLNKI